MGCPAECEIGDTLVFSICTHDPDTGVLTDADAPPTYRVYEDETGSPAAILTGSMAKLDDGNTTGFYTETITCSSGNGFEVGKTYTVYIEATVDSDTGGICYGFKAILPSGIPKAVALSNFPFVMINGTDHVTPKTGLTITATISKDGGAFAACTNSASEIGNGVYKITLTSAEMDAATVILKFTATGADQRTITLVTSD